MKKLLSLIFAILIAFSLVACSGGTTVVESNDAENPSSESSDILEKDTTTKDEEIAFEEQVVVDNEECKITITGIDPDDVWGFTLKALLENKSADKTYMFAVETAAINGVVCDPFFASEVAAGKKANENISFSSTVLDDNGITEYTDIELTFRVYDSDDWMADEVANETVHVYPDGEDKATAFVRKAQATDTVLVDNEYATVIVTEYDPNGFYGYTVSLFIVNKTDTTIMVSAEDVSVNGFMVDPFYATSVPAGKMHFSEMAWFDTDFEENGITEVEEIEFQLRVYDNEDWVANDFVSKVFTMIPI